MDSKTPNRADAGMCLKCRRRCKQGEREVMRRYEEKLRSICTVHGDLNNYNEVHVRVRMKDNVRFGFIIDNVIWQEAFRIIARKLLNSSATTEDLDKMGIELKYTNERDVPKYDTGLCEENICLRYMWGAGNEHTKG